MARRFTRRKPRVVWLPTFGNTSFGEDGGAAQAGGMVFGVGLNDTIGIAFDAAALTWDGNNSPSAAQGFGSTSESLADFTQGSSYRLRRIVGKFWCGATTNGIATNVMAIQVAFGFIIGRADPNGDLQTDFQNVNPLFQDSMDDPWIWRRSWLIAPAPYDTANRWGAIPFTNIEYGSVADGPHIDQKTARVVGPEERLVGIMAARVFETVDHAAIIGAPEVSGYLDYRLLASMRSNVGNRRNASR